jgi:hypothetical protein
LIEEARGGGGAWVQVPPSVVEELGGAGRIRFQRQKVGYEAGKDRGGSAGVGRVDITRRICVLAMSILIATGCFRVSSVGERPPPLVVTAGDARLDLQPYTLCWNAATSGYCADGIPPDPLPSLGEIGEDIKISWPFAGWEFVASIQKDGADAVDVELMEQAGQRVIEVDDLDGIYDVSLSGFGPQGDVHYQFSVEVVLAG